jgi:transcriptional regulator with XRE-family HTH domain
MAAPKAVALWSAHEIRALRKAMRLTLDGFASELGVSTRSVSTWEAGDDKTFPRAVNQEALDTFFSTAKPEIRDRFYQLAGLSPTVESPSIRPANTSDTNGDTEADPDQFAIHPIDGKEMALVEAGIYISGAEPKPIWMPAFYIDIYPTVNVEYAKFVAVTGHGHPIGWADPDLFSTCGNHPVVFVTWLDAAAYADWTGKRLPTSHEWEKAARGSRGNIYPWGSQMTPAKCNVRENKIGTTTPVDKYQSGVSPYGVYDMCGNVWEWCSSTTDDGRRELKGSAFTSPFARATPSNFNDAAETMSDDDTGFRCAISYDKMQAILSEKDN